MDVGFHQNQFLPAVGAFLVLCANFAYADLSGAGVTLPESGFILVQERILLLHGIQMIASDALCEDKSGQWPCGKTAWKAFEKKLTTAPVQCMLMVDLAWQEDLTGRAICLLNDENLNAWLVRHGWALTGSRPETIFSSEESHARKDQLGIWRGGFIPPEAWRLNALHNRNRCDVCKARHQSALRTRDKLKKLGEPQKNSE